MVAHFRQDEAGLTIRTEHPVQQARVAQEEEQKVELSWICQNNHGASEICFNQFLTHFANVYVSSIPGDIGGPVMLAWDVFYTYR